jgi:hypothetical protein
VQAAARPSIQTEARSVPLPIACAIATGQSAYVAQCTVRKTRGPDALAQQADHDDHGEQVDRERAQAQPEWAVGAQERPYRVDQPELREGIEEEGHDVDADEGRAGQRGGAVHLVDAEPAEPGDGPARAAEDAEHDRDREHDQRHDARAAAEGPQCLVHRGPRGSVSLRAVSWGEFMWLAPRGIR